MLLSVREGPGGGELRPGRRMGPRRGRSSPSAAGPGAREEEKEEELLPGSRPPFLPHKFPRGSGAPGPADPSRFPARPREAPLTAAGVGCERADGDERPGVGRRSPELRPGAARPWAFQGGGGRGGNSPGDFALITH